jgi:hypothetical protein
VERKLGGSFHPRLDIGKTPIVKKYREGKMKRTSEGGLKLPETVEREPIGDLFANVHKRLNSPLTLRKRGLEPFGIDLGLQAG